jgi:hypothetical protein
MLRDFHGDIYARPGCSEYANILIGINVRYSVLMAVYASAAEAFDTWNMWNVADSIMTIAQYHGIKSFHGLYFAL